MRTPPDQNVPPVRLRELLLQRRAGVRADVGTAPTPTPTPTATPAPRWTAEEIKAEWRKTDRGKEILRDLPATTKFRSYERTPGERRYAFYRPSEDTIYIPSSYTSAEAAATAAHEATHAIQHKDHPDRNDAERIEREVEAKNAGLDVWEQLLKPSVPYDYATDSASRARDRAAFEEKVRRAYRAYYGIAEPTPSPTPTANPSPTSGP